MSVKSQYFRVIAFDVSHLYIKLNFRRCNIYIVQKFENKFVSYR